MAFKIFLLWTFVLIARPQDLLPALQSIRPALVLFLICVIAIFIEARERKLSSIFEVAETKKYLLFYIIMILSIPFAYHRRQAFEFTFLSYLSNIAFFLLFMLQVDSLRKLKSITFVVWFCSLFYSFFVIRMGHFAGERFEIYGAMFDSNDIAFILTALLPLNFFYISRGRSMLVKLFPMISITTSVMVILFSGSRGGLLGFIVVLALLVFVKVLHMKPSYKIALLACILLVYFYNSEEINIERYLSLTDIGSDYNVTEESGRLHVWERGLDMVVSNPLTGVGVSCFPMAIGSIRETLGLQPRWQTAHNSFILVASEIGLIGFFLFVSLVVGCLRNFYHQSSYWSASKETDEVGTLSGFLFICFIGLLVTAFFLSQAYSILFTLFFAFSGAIRRLTSDPYAYEMADRN